MKIALVPLDDRPCNLKFPVKLASTSKDIQIITPPKGSLGYFKTPGDTKAISKWIAENATETDVMIISADMLAYGGLIASRTPCPSFEDAVENLKVIGQLKSINPKLKVYLFGIIMRLSVTADSNANKEIWEKIFRYSVSAGSPENKPETERLAAEIPAQALQDYLNARKRNHEINRYCVGLSGDNKVDLLVLGKEDVARSGLHKKEEEALRVMIREKALSNKVMIMNGADEIASVLTARSIIESKNEHPKIAVRYSSGKEGVSLYEDVPLKDVVSDHIKAAGATEVEKIEEAGIVLFVNSFDEKQIDIFFEDPLPRNGKELHHLDNVISEIIMMKSLDIKAAVADVRYANGADPELMEHMSNFGKFGELSAYSGWNTSSNSIGTALAQAVLPVNDSFLAERFLDDYCYQSIVRKHINDWIDLSLADGAVSKFDLRERKSDVEEQIAGVMIEWVKDFTDKGENKIGSFGKSLNSGVRIKLPWPRTFEIDCDIIFS